MTEVTREEREELIALAKGISCGFFSCRATINEANEFHSSIVNALEKNERFHVTTGLWVMLNTISNTINRILDKKEEVNNG